MRHDRNDDLPSFEPFRPRKGDDFRREREAERTRRTRRLRSRAAS